MTVQKRARLGPRPLPLHLAAPMSLYATSIAALPFLRTGSHHSKQSFNLFDPNLFKSGGFGGAGFDPTAGPQALFAQTLQAGLFATLDSFKPDFSTVMPELDKADMGDLTREIDATFRSSLNRMLTGIAAYQHHPFQRPESQRPVIWSEGTTSLTAFSENQSARPVLVIPSLINRAYIMDLLPDLSFCESLTEQGLAPYLVDWAAPGPDEQAFDLTDYVKRLDRMLDLLRQRHKQPVSLVGYCMGGLLALPLALRHQDAVNQMVLLATPWDFHTEYPGQGQQMKSLLELCEPVMGFFGNLPIDLIQALFASLDPLMAYRKFQAFADQDPDSETTRRFVALEDWLNDGVPLTCNVAREALGQWYGDNAPIKRAWKIDGDTVDPSEYQGETLVVIPTNDRIVPPRSALAITESLSDVRLMRPQLGHIGMMSSAGAHSLWKKLGAFLNPS